MERPFPLAGVAVVYAYALHNVKSKCHFWLAYAWTTTGSAVICASELPMRFISEMHRRRPVPKRDVDVRPPNLMNRLGMDFNPRGFPLGQCPCLSRTLDTRGKAAGKSRCGLGAGYDRVKKSFS